MNSMHECTVYMKSFLISLKAATSPVKRLGPSAWSKQQKPT